jgi:hypothetical protein
MFSLYEKSAPRSNREQRWRLGNVVEEDHRVRLFFLETER